LQSDEKKGGSLVAATLYTPINYTPINFPILNASEPLNPP
jgi:hypothetical protein